MMPGADRQGHDAALARLQELIGALEAHPDPSARAPAQELVSLVLDLHGHGLARLMALVTAADRDGTLMAQLVDDDTVRSMLLLHGLHPDDMETRVHRAVERLHPHLGVNGLRLDVVSVERGNVRLAVRNTGGDPIPASLLFSLPGEIENAIVEAAPDAEQVVVDGLAPGLGQQVNAAE